ncbi:unnamed protein product [Cyprideis torosa]|uniref:Sodium-dependent nutrient amino acid transporter 1 n=1 Tax=Cyprideis torosa TaxID=163714 RepID=A0A7R8ZTM9_9CRUS|nr:unnamed protein product [Cyprideis torosa]CAG0908449.1 unnamed protein product [Cyprideis torosa]
MLFTLGVGSAVGLISTSIIIVHDHFPRFSKFWITTFFCIVGFLAGIPYVTPGGPYILSLVNFFGGGFCIFVIATVEIIAIVLTYGIQRLSIDTQFMLGTYPSWFWRFTWTFTSPLLLLVILVYALSTLEVPVYQDAYHFSPGVLGE